MTYEGGARNDPPPAAGTTAAAPGRLGAFLARPYAPVMLALALALLSSPVVAWSLTLPLESPWQIEAVGWVPVDAAPAMLLALAAVIPAALVGGSLGGRARLQHPVLGAFAAVWISWAIGIMVLPAAAALLGVRLRMGVWCIDSCFAHLRDGLVNGVIAYFDALFSGLVFVLPWLVGGLLAALAAAAGRRHKLIAGVVLAVLAHGAVHFWSLFYGGLPAWLCLAVGVVIWSTVLPRPAPRPAAPPPRTAWTASGSGPSAEQGPPAAAAPPAGHEPPAPPAGQPPLPFA